MQPSEPSTETMPVGVVLERLPSRTRWQRWSWRAVEAVPGIEPRDAWRLLREAGERTLFLAAPPPLCLHRKETEDYRYALSAEPPQLYAVLRRIDADPVPFAPFLLTASPFEAQAYQEHGDDLVEAVPMPEVIIAWVAGFVERHPTPQPFLKRRRKGADKQPGDGSDFVPLD